MTELTHNPAEVDADRVIVLERVFDAPRSLVFRTWTDARHLPRWMGPKGFTITTHAIDVRPGGSWNYIMHGPDGTNYDNFMRFLEIVPNERLVYDHGETPDGPPHFRVTVTFEEEGAKTRMRHRMVFPTAAAVEVVKGFGAVELGYQTLDKLAEQIKELGLRFTRTFDAPRDLVYKAWSEPERLAKWWGPKGMGIEVKQMAFEPGGIFHYRMFNDQGAEMWGRFRYIEMEAPERLVWINSFSDPEGGLARAPFAAEFPLEIYNLVTFTEQGGKTVLELTGGPLDASEAEWAFYDGMRPSMQQGFGGTFEQLEAYLAEAQQA